MKTSRITTVSLAALVCISLFESFMLWKGNWETITGDIGAIDVFAQAPAVIPKLDEVTSPYQVEIMNGKQGRDVIGGPSTNLYHTWLGTLREVRLQGLEPSIVTSLHAGTPFVRFDMGIQLSPSSLLRILPAVTSTPLSVQAEFITLFPSSSNRNIDILIQTKNDSYEGTTDLSVSRFESLRQSFFKQAAWAPWNLQSRVFLPSEPFPMPTWTCQVETFPIIPMVHSFFVNPSALTRIRENPNTVLWTDGSRAVEWDEGKGEISYEDPNASAATYPGIFSADIIVKYMQNHGGGPEFGFLFDESGQADVNLSQTFVLQPYFQGYPIVNASSSYGITLTKGSITQYTRPLKVIVYHTAKVLTTSTVITITQLRAVLNHLMPSTVLSNLEVVLGYEDTSTSHDNMDQFKPVYYISQSGIWLWTIDAYTGKVLKGMST